MDTQPIKIELIPSPDRVKLIVLMSSDTPIGIITAVDALAKYAAAVKEKFDNATSGIVAPPTKKIIAP